MASLFLYNRYITLDPFGEKMHYSYPQQTFQEVPGEITLALSISGCPLRCKNCHSKETYPSDFGTELTEQEIDKLLLKFKHTSCILFYGGEWEMDRLIELIEYVKSKGLFVCLYSGMNLEDFSDDFIERLDFIKVGRYRERKGNLRSPTTNQRFYAIEYGKLVDNTHLFTV